MAQLVELTFNSYCSCFCCCCRAFAVAVAVAIAVAVAVAVALAVDIAFAVAVAIDVAVVLAVAVAVAIAVAVVFAVAVPVAIAVARGCTGEFPALEEQKILFGSMHATKMVCASHANLIFPHSLHYRICQTPCLTKLTPVASFLQGPNHKLMALVA